jgi:hypothetical protein
MSSSREVRHRKSRRLKIEWLVLTLVRVRFLLEASARYLMACFSRKVMEKIWGYGTELKVGGRLDAFPVLGITQS